MTLNPTSVPDVAAPVTNGHFDEDAPQLKMKESLWCNGGFTAFTAPNDTQGALVQPNGTYDDTSRANTLANSLSEFLLPPSLNSDGRRTTQAGESSLGLSSMRSSFSMLIPTQTVVQAAVCTLDQPAVFNPTVATPAIPTAHGQRESLASSVPINTSPILFNVSNGSSAPPQPLPATTAISCQAPTGFGTARGRSRQVVAHPTILYYLPTSTSATSQPSSTLPIDMGRMVTHTPVAAGHQPIRAMVCESWRPTSLQGLPVSLPNGVPVQNAAVPLHATNFATTEAHANGGNQPFLKGQQGHPSPALQNISAQHASGYKSGRAHQAQNRRTPAWQRSGTNVHGALQGMCTYYSYNLSAALKQYEQRDAQSCSPEWQTASILIRMYPCELRNRTVIVLNRVIEATCGPDVAVVVNIESRFEAAFVMHVKTNSVQDLVSALHNRVLMDRHGFWYAKTVDQRDRMREYCEGMCSVPRKECSANMDGLPRMPLVLEPLNTPIHPQESSLTVSQHNTDLTANASARVGDELKEQLDELTSGAFPT
ncbi:hypothetical protein ERJ75_000229100 [Trypanosoma vivax]|nr:hypothetical protein TRVL_06371 [Trypanosoma vivax]KAH8618902.1 hypothetical protein ERJ75_000229100 [Trypanosoma vivax]